jgi:hypothetical protein
MNVLIVYKNVKLLFDSEDNARLCLTKLKSINLLCIQSKGLSAESITESEVQSYFGRLNSLRSTINKGTGLISGIPFSIISAPDFIVNKGLDYKKVIAMEDENGKLYFKGSSNNAFISFSLLKSEKIALIVKGQSKGLSLVNYIKSLLKKGVVND